MTQLDIGDDDSLVNKSKPYPGLRCQFLPATITVEDKPIDGYKLIVGDRELGWIRAYDKCILDWLIQRTEGYTYVYGYIVNRRSYVWRHKTCYYGTVLIRFREYEDSSLYFSFSKDEVPEGLESARIAMRDNETTDKNPAESDQEENSDILPKVSEINILKKEDMSDSGM